MQPGRADDVSCINIYIYYLLATVLDAGSPKMAAPAVQLACCSHLKMYLFCYKMESLGHKILAHNQAFEIDVEQPNIKK